MIIVPINNTREVNCIIQEGIRYCENTPTTPESAGYMIIFTLIIMIWIIGPLFYDMDYGFDYNSFYCKYKVFILSAWYILPPLFIGLSLIGTI